MSTNYPINDLPQPIDVKTAIVSSGIDITVPDKEICWCGPFDSFANAFRIAEVKQFEDMQDLSLIPAGISERDASEAMLADEEVHQELIHREQMERHACTCSGSEPQSLSLRRTGRRHLHLEKLLNASCLRVATKGDPEVLQTIHHLRRWFTRSGRLLVGVFIPKDITIGSGATLVMSPTVHVLRANNITMDWDSRLRFESGTVSVQCESLNGPIFSPPINEPPWGNLNLPVVWPPIPRPGPPDPTHQLRNFSIGKYLRGFTREFSSGV